LFFNENSLLNGFYRKFNELRFNDFFFLLFTF